MVSKKKKHTGDDRVDEWIPNQVVKDVNHDEIGSMARDVHVEESVYSSITKDKDKTFKVKRYRISMSLCTTKDNHGSVVHGHCSSCFSVPKN